jgi:hypothetical protein
LLDKDCRAHAGPVFRIHFNTNKHNYGVALRPKDRFVVRTKNAPLFKKGEVNKDHYRTAWFRIVRHPEGWRD